MLLSIQTIFLLIIKTSKLKVSAIKAEAFLGVINKNFSQLNVDRDFIKRR